MIPEVDMWISNLMKFIVSDTWGWYVNIKSYEIHRVWYLRLICEYQISSNSSCMIPEVDIWISNLIKFIMYDTWGWYVNIKSFQFRRVWYLRLICKYQIWSNSSCMIPEVDMWVSNFIKFIVYDTWGWYMNIKSYEIHYVWYLRLICEYQIFSISSCMIPEVDMWISNLMKFIVSDTWGWYVNIKSDQIHHVWYLRLICEYQILSNSSCMIPEVDIWISNLMKFIVSDTWGWYVNIKSHQTHHVWYLRLICELNTQPLSNRED